MSSIEFDSPANRIISQFAPKDKFRIDTSLPDLAFLRQLSVQGRLRYFTGTSATTPAITITPNIGETIFIYRIFFANTSASANSFTYINDGNTRIVQTLGTVNFEFTILDSLAGDGVKTMTFDGSQTESITVLGWSENTSRIRDASI